MPYIPPDGVSETLLEYIMLRGRDHSKKARDAWFLCACLCVSMFLLPRKQKVKQVLSWLASNFRALLHFSGKPWLCVCVSPSVPSTLVQYVSLGHCELFDLVQVDRSCPSSSLHCSDGLCGQPSEMRSPLHIATFFAKWEKMKILTCLFPIVFFSSITFDFPFWPCSFYTQWNLLRAIHSLKPFINCKYKVRTVRFRKAMPFKRFTPLNVSSETAGRSGG